MFRYGLIHHHETTPEPRFLFAGDPRSVDGAPLCLTLYLPPRLSRFFADHARKDALLPRCTRRISRAPHTPRYSGMHDTWGAFAGNLWVTCRVRSWICTSVGNTVGGIPPRGSDARLPRRALTGMTSFPSVLPYYLVDFAPTSHCIRNAFPTLNNLAASHRSCNTPANVTDYIVCRTILRQATL